MKTAVLIVRILLGGLMVFSSLNFFLHFMPEPAMEGEVQKFMVGIEASVYLMPLVKAVELLAGLALLAGYFVPLANVVLFPISLNIFFFHLFMMPDGLAVGIFTLGANLFLAYWCRAHYKPLFFSGIDKKAGDFVTQ